MAGPLLDGLPLAWIGTQNSLGLCSGAVSQDSFASRMRLPALRRAQPACQSGTDVGVACSDAPCVRHWSTAWGAPSSAPTCATLEPAPPPVQTPYDPNEWPGAKAWPATMGLISFFSLSVFFQALVAALQ